MDFTGYQYPSDIILQAIRYYVSYKLSIRDIEEIFTERGSAIDHSLNCSNRLVRIRMLGGVGGARL
ncbi:hypothetical protein [Photobacterium carnosum]|uniref:hypothetical protein n=1 Tax=Photobacterium carnosum TaxID=2023717 RepID=UPI0039F6AA2D